MMKLIAGGNWVDACEALHMKKGFKAQVVVRRHFSSKFFNWTCEAGYKEVAAYHT